MWLNFDFLTNSTQGHKFQIPKYCLNTSGEIANKYIHKNAASFLYAVFTSLYFDKFKSMG